MLASSAGRSTLSASILLIDDHAAQLALLRPRHHAPRREFDSGLGVDDDGRGVDRSERAHRLAAEIRIAGGVDQVNVRVAPGEIHQRGVERVAVGLFQRIVVADGVAALDTAGRFDCAGARKQRFRQGGLARRAVTD